MDIILVSNNRSRTRRISIARRSPGLWIALGLSLTLTVGGGFSLGWILKDHQGPGDVPRGLAKMWERQVADQREELLAARAEAEESTRMLSQRVARLQAHVLRLDAAGNRMTEIAGLDPTEFSFNSDPAIGGPESPVDNGPGESELILGSLDAFEAGLKARERQMRVLEDILLAGRQQQRSKPSGWPVIGGYVSSVFGWRADPFTGRRTRHNGVDFAAPAGSAVRSVAAGIVTRAGYHSGYGRLVEVNHGNGYVTRYGHNSKIVVEIGDKVRNGQTIAHVGSSGRATGPHVHFELELNGHLVNPARYLQAAH